MKRITFALALGLCVLSSAHAADAQTSGDLLDQEDPQFCAHADSGRARRVS